jgi:hypothetical protein
VNTPRTVFPAARLLCASLWLLPNLASALSDLQPPTATIVSEDFVPLRNDWMPASGNWSISAGTYNSLAGSNSDIATIAEYRQLAPAAEPTPTVNFDHYSVSARVRTKGTTALKLAGLVYQYQDPSDYLEAVVSATGVVSIRRTFLGRTDTLASFILGVPRDTWVDLEVQYDKTKGLSTLLVNGQVLRSGVIDLSLRANGQVGLVTHGAVGNFDKVQVTTPFGDQPFKHDFATDAPGWTPQSGTWTVQNGTYNDTTVQQTNITLAPIHTGVTTGSDETGPFTMHARMFNGYGASGNQLGIVFDYAGAQYTEVVFSPTGVAKMNVVTNKVVKTLATAAYGGRQKVWFDVTLDSTASVWVDGEKIFDHVPGANRDLVPQGGVGLITHWAPGKFDDVWFDHGVFANPCNEPFDAPNSSLEAVSGTWTVSGGALNGTSVIANSVAIPCRSTGNFSGADAGTDFVLSARLLNQYANSGNRVGLTFNYQAPSSLFAGDYYEVVFAPTGNGFLNKVIEGVRYQVAQFPHPVPRNTFFDVQLFRSGINTTVMVNGTTVLRDIPQGELRGGRAGVITHFTLAKVDDVSMQPYVVRSAPVSYKLTLIDRAPTSSNFGFFVSDINDQGVVTGSRSSNPDGKGHAFTWHAGTFHYLDASLPPNNGAGISAINNQGDVIGEYNAPDIQDHTFFFDASDKAIPMPGLPGGRLDLIDVNDRRDVLLEATTQSSQGPVFQNYIWSNGQLVPLSALPGSQHMTAVAINNDGLAIGYAHGSSIGFVPVIWENGAVMPINIPPGGDNSLTRAINDHGAVAAYEIFRDEFPGRSQPFIWHEGETTLLGRLNADLPNAQPFDINNAGVVVGVSFEIGFPESATIWDGTRARDLNDAIDRQDPSQPFVRLTGPTAQINNHGEMVIGGSDSRQPGVGNWYLLTPVATQ